MRAPAVLPNYRRPRSKLERVLKHGAFLSLCIGLGLFYGFFFTLLPPFMLVYLALPIVLLAIVVIWALPDTDRAPTRLLTRLFFALLIAMLLWPNYLAIQLPGLPWMTMRRLIAFPMVGVLMICLSTSRPFRADLVDSLKSVRPLSIMLAAFMLVQFLTIFWSVDPISAINSTLNHWVAITSCFFVAAYAFRSDAHVDLFIRILIGCAFVLLIIGTAEWINGQVLWANHIPSFLRVDEAVLKSYLEARARAGEYRVAAVFTVSLCFAEFLAFVTPFVIHRIMITKDLFWMAIWGLFDVALLAVINMTQSRLGILGWITAHAMYGCIWAFVRWRKLRTDIVGPAVSIGASGVAVFLFIGMFTIPAIRNRTIGGGVTLASDQARQDQFAAFWPKLWDNVFGYGSGTSGQVLGYFSPGGLLTVDSSVITFALDYGVIGLMLFASILVYATWKMVSISWGRGNPPDLALPLACTIMIIIQIRLVLSQFDNMALIYVFLGLVAAVALRARRQDAFRPDPSETGASARV